MGFVVDNEPAPSVHDLPIDRAFDDDLRARLDGQAAQEISANVQGAVFLNDGVVENRAGYVRRNGNFHGFLC
jgi:hypothetical protein